MAYTSVIVTVHSGELLFLWTLPCPTTPSTPVLHLFAHEIESVLVAVLLFNYSRWHQLNECK